MLKRWAKKSDDQDLASIISAAFSIGPIGIYFGVFDGPFESNWKLTFLVYYGFLAIAFLVIFLWAFIDKNFESLFVDNHDFSSSNLFWLLVWNAAALTLCFSSSSESERQGTMALLYTGFVIGFIPGIIAFYKGRNFINWWYYGKTFFLIALVHSIALKSEPKMLAKKGLLKQCTYCAEYIKPEAVVCRHCHSKLDRDP